MKEKNQASVVTVTLNPAVDVTLYFSHFILGSVNRVQEERKDPGGKGINVAKVVRALGEGVAVTGFLGMKNKDVFEEYFARHGIVNHFVELPGETRANYKLVDREQGRVTEINYPGLQASQENMKALWDKLLQVADCQPIIVFSGSLPPGMPETFYKEALRRIQPAGCKTYLDTSGTALAEGIKGIPYMVKPNLEELRQLTGRDLDVGQGLEEVADELLASGIQEVVVSLGERGSFVATRTKRILAQAPVVKVGSTVGTGDALVAGLAVGEARGLSLAERIRLATATAAASVMRPGTQAASSSEVEGLLSQVVLKS